ncbi:hypothetical protein BC830DRAFT_187821 [Chytriomyces sp. MP71]|nr:hypothetical protein BC830DRAFT_187821 [Chytriomyces sp. MP71]
MTFRVTILISLHAFLFLVLRLPFNLFFVWKKSNLKTIMLNELSVSNRTQSRYSLVETRRKQHLIYLSLPLLFQFRHEPQCILVQLIVPRNEIQRAHPFCIMTFVVAFSFLKSQLHFCNDAAEWHVFTFAQRSEKFSGVMFFSHYFLAIAYFSSSSTFYLLVLIQFPHAPTSLRSLAVAEVS